MMRSSGASARMRSIAGDDWLEFDSMINIRPWQDNRSRGVEDEATRAKVVGVVDRLVER